MIEQFVAEQPLKLKSISLITLFPEVLQAYLKVGLLGKALDAGLCSIDLIQLRDFAINEYGTVDDRPYGGGPGMVMRVEPLVAAIRSAKKNTLPESCKTILLSPQGQLLNTAMIQSLLQCEQLVLVAGRYEGVDERVMALEVDQELSIGDYVLMGGELPALVLIEALIRRLPGVLGNEKSAQFDSFERAELDHPHYTRPSVFEGLAVPEVLCSGDHQAISEWRAQQRVERTRIRRPDLLIN